MNKKTVLLVLAILSGIAAMFLVRLYIQGIEASYKRKFQTVVVVAAAENLIVGTEIKRSSLGTKEVLTKTASNRNVLVDQVDTIVGRKVRNPVSQGAQLLWTDIVGDEQKGGNLAMMVKPEERAVSIPVDLTASVTGLVEPNDHVDILGTFTFPSTKGDAALDMVTITILQNVTVLATGKETARTLMDAAIGGGTRRAASYSNVTILVSPKEAEMLVFAMRKGSLTLTLRNPEDVSSARDLTSINFNYLEKKVGEFNEARQKRLTSGTAP